MLGIGADQYVNMNDPEHMESAPQVDVVRALAALRPPPWPRAPSAPRAPNSPSCPALRLSSSRRCQ